MNSPNTKILQKKFEEEFQNSSYKATQGEGSSSRIFKEKSFPLNFQFGSLVLSTYSDPNKKFKPYTGVEIDFQQQCLLDNLWHIQTLSNATAFKVQTLNALSFYFSDLKKEGLGSKKFSQKFSHYVIYRGTKLGVFHDYNTVRKFINCPNPSWKGYYSFKEALDNAREALSFNFFIEPEEVSRCFICGDLNHLANRCPNKDKNNGYKERSNLIEQIGDFEIEQLSVREVLFSRLSFS